MYWFFRYKFHTMIWRFKGLHHRGINSLWWSFFGLLGFKEKIWQRNYYEHIIRDGKAFQNISEYIKNNPVKWMGDKFYLKWTSEFLSWDNCNSIIMVCWLNEQSLVTPDFDSAQLPYLSASTPHSVKNLLPSINEYSYRYNQYKMKEGILENLMRRILAKSPYSYRTFIR